MGKWIGGLVPHVFNLNTGSDWSTSHPSHSNPISTLLGESSQSPESVCMFWRRENPLDPVKIKSHCSVIQQTVKRTEL